MKIYSRSTKQIKIVHDERSNIGSVLTGAVNINEKAKHNPVSTPRFCFRIETIGCRNARAVFCIAETVPCRLTNEL
jgi:hypothetical protein